MKYEKTLKSICRQPKLSLAQIESMFRKQSSVEVSVVQKNIGRDGFEIQTDEGLAFVTERPITYLNKKWGRVTGLQERMLDLLIPVPLYIGEGTVVSDINRINKSENPMAEANDWLHESFTVEIAVAYFNKYLSVSESFKGYKSIIFEAIEAYYLGLDHVAIMSLFPVFEAGLRNIQAKLLNTSKGNVSTEGFDRGLRDLILSWGRSRFAMYSWYPGKGYNTEVEIDFLTHVNPQCDVINAFRLFFKHVLYKPSNAGASVNGFNRHLVVHLLKNEFNESSNFARLFLALTQITFIESLHNRDVPFFWQGIDESDQKISYYIRALTDQFFLPRRGMLKDQGICEY